MQRLQQYDWPGNVRELQHVIERAVITSTGGRLNIELPFQAKALGLPKSPSPMPRVRTDAQIRQLEADNIRAALKAANGKVSGPGGAAQLLGLKPTTLASRIKALESCPQSAPDGGVRRCRDTSVEILDLAKTSSFSAARSGSKSS